MEGKILELVNSREFQSLADYYEKCTIFETLKVQCKENQHNAFIAWWLDPKAEHGLNEAPLKLLMRLIATKDMGRYIFNSDVYAKVIAGNYKVEVLDGVEVEKCVNNDKNKCIDIWAVLKMTFETADESQEFFYPLAIENKIYSKGGGKRNIWYLNDICAHLMEYPQEKSGKGIQIFLSANGTQPEIHSFTPISYRELLTYVIEPLVQIVAEEQRDFVDSYLRSQNGNLYDNEEQYNVLAISKDEKRDVDKLYDAYKDVFDKTFVASFPENKVCEIIGKERFNELLFTEEEMAMLYELWAAHEKLFKIIAYQAYEGKKDKLDKLFRPCNRGVSKYIVKYRGMEIFPNERLSRSRAALAIFMAYLAENPQSDLNALRDAFPCEKLNQYYYGRYYNELFYPSQPDNIDEEGYEILSYTAGKHIDKEARAECDFYVDELLLPIEDESKMAMCVKMWKKHDFESLKDWVDEKYKFIEVQECL